MNTGEEWPAGQTYAFQGTVAQDATAGTHVASLTVVPGAGNEMILQAGTVTIGSTATAQQVQVFVDDGTNVLYHIIGPNVISTTTSGEIFNFPSAGNIAVSAFAADVDPIGYAPFIISGTMRLVLRVTTTQVSVTQTFAVVCRIRGTLPTATLNDTIGTSVNTTNTNRVF